MKHILIMFALILMFAAVSCTDESSTPTVDETDVTETEATPDAGETEGDAVEEAEVSDTTPETD